MRWCCCGERNFAVFFVASILICIPLAFYYQNANQFLTEIHVANATGKQTIGQMSEVLFMLLIPVFLRTLRHEDHAAARHAGLGAAATCCSRSAMRRSSPSC